MMEQRAGRGISQEEALLPKPPPSVVITLPKEERQFLGGHLFTRQVSRQQSRSLKGPLRAVRLCIMCIIFPVLLIAVPLYMRCYVYGEQVYPIGVSDMRLADSKVSTTWCQKEIVKSNVTFNAFLMSEQPSVHREPLKLSMSRELVLEDDMKEYWAFYLLRDSVVTVSACVRWPGASLIVLRGHKHLHECAYIGDDSSEELDELEKLSWPVPVRNVSKDNDGESNEPEKMRRVRPGVTLHGHEQPLESHEQLEHLDGEDDLDTVLGQYLRRIENTKPKSKTTDSPRQNQNPKNESSPDPQVTSSGEVFEDILKKLRLLGPKGTSVLKRLNQQLKVSEDVEDSDDDETEQRNNLRQMILELLNEQKQDGAEQKQDGAEQKQDGAEQKQDGADRKKRDIYLQSPTSQHNLDEDDEKDNAAIEEGLEPDGIADHHVTLNETTLNDMSQSEFWSSFSSSEETLLNCAGLIVNLPLTPHSSCQHDIHHDQIKTASHKNTLTYRVPTNGYYFFIFSSENEIQPNYFHVSFHLEKVVYDVSQAVSECRNATEECALPLSFFSSQKVVLEVPVSGNESLWNGEYIAVTTCEPRTALYVVCVVAVPFFILLFSFQ